MRKATLTRYETNSHEGTFGHYMSDSCFECCVVEKPWRGNAQGDADTASCIPAGTYECQYGESPKFGKCYRLLNVPGRSGVLIHSGNWERQSLGCLIPGRAVGLVLGIKGVMSSRDTLNGLEDDMDRGPFMLAIRWGDGLDPEKQT